MNNNSWMSEAKDSKNGRTKFLKNGSTFPGSKSETIQRVFCFNRSHTGSFRQRPACRDRATPLCTHFLNYVFHDMTWDELEESYKGPNIGMEVDSAQNSMIENTTVLLNRTVVMFAFDEFPDETNKENLLVMLSAKIMDNGGHTLSDWLTEALYESSHKIQKQYNDINTGAYHRP